MNRGKISSAGSEREFLHQGDRGELRLLVPAPTVFVFEYKGYSNDAFVPFVADVWQRTCGRRSDKIQVFADTEHQTGYSHGFRTALMSWSKTMVAQTDVYCLLVKSRWVAMGIAIVRSTVGLPAAHAEVTTNRDLFRGKLDAAVRRSLAQTSSA